MKFTICALFLLASANLLAEETELEFNADFFNNQLHNPKVQDHMYMYASGVMNTILMYEKECNDLDIVPTKEWMLQIWNVGVTYLLGEKQSLKNYSVEFVFRTSIVGQCRFLQEKKKNNK